MLNGMNLERLDRSQVPEMDVQHLPELNSGQTRIAEKHAGAQYDGVNQLPLLTRSRELAER